MILKNPRMAKNVATKGLERVGMWKRGGNGGKEEVTTWNRLSFVFTKELRVSALFNPHTIYKKKYFETSLFEQFVAERL